MSRSSFWEESRKTLKLAVPIIIGNVGQTMIMVTDNVMVGRIGAGPLGAAGFSGSLYYIFLLFGFGLLAPTAALFAKSHGRNEHQEGAELLRHTVIAATLSSMLMILLLILLKPLLAHMGQSPEVVTLSNGFFPYLMWSLLPSLLYQAYKQFTDGIGKTSVGMVVMLAAVGLNIIGNSLFIHGFWIFPAMGLNGSGLSTLLSRSFMAIAMMIYVHRHPQFTIYFAQRWRRAWHSPLLQQIFRLGLPNGMTYIFEVGAFSLSSVMIGWLGAAPLAAHQIALNIAAISFLVTVGIGVAGSIRVGYELGQGQTRKAIFAGRVAVILGAIFMFCSALFVINNRKFLAGLYTKDTAVIGFAASYLVVAAAFQFFDGLQAVTVGVLRGFQDTKWPSVFAFISYWIIGLPIGYWLAFHHGLEGDGVWWGLFLGLMFTAIFLTSRFEVLGRRLLRRETVS